MGKEANGERERVQIHVWVQPETKERWSEHVAESVEHSSLSGLIRRSVEREIESSGSGGSHPGIEGGDVGSVSLEGIETTNERLSEVLDAVSSLDRRIDGLDDDVRDVKSSLELASGEDSIDELAELVFDELPKSFQKAENLAIAGPPEDGRDPDEPTGNPYELAVRLNVPESRIMDALDRLDETMPGMIDAVGDGVGNKHGHYYSG